MNWTAVAPCTPIGVAAPPPCSLDDERTPADAALAWRDEEEHRLKGLFLEHENRIVQRIEQALVRELSSRKVEREKRTSAGEPDLVRVGSDVSLASLFSSRKAPAPRSRKSLKSLEQQREEKETDEHPTVGVRFGSAIEKSPSSSAPSKKRNFFGGTKRSTTDTVNQFNIDVASGARSLAKTQENLDQAVRKTQVSRKSVHPWQTDIGSNDGFSMRAFSQKVCDSKPFQLGIMVIIFASAVSVGVQADFAIKYTPEPMPDSIMNVEKVMAIIFAVELFLRVASEASNFLKLGNKNFFWNFLDSFLVAFSVVDQVLLSIEFSQSPDMSIMRTVRVFRLVRVFRIVRVARFFNDMRVMVAGIASSMKSLVWALLLLLIIGFIFAVCFLELVSMEIDAIHERPDDFDVTVEEMREGIRSTWGSLMGSIYTLFQSISGGVDWGSVVAPLIEVNPLIGLLFNFYIAMAVFCVLNIVTGIFVENAKLMTQNDEASIVMQTIEQRKQWIEEVKGLWSSFTDDPGVGEVDLDTFCRHVQDVRIQALFRRLGLEIEAENMPGLFALLDFNGNGKVDIDEFAMGIQMLHGQAKSIDMARMRYNVFNIQQEVIEMRELLFRVLKRLHVEEGLRQSTTICAS